MRSLLLGALGFLILAHFCLHLLWRSGWPAAHTATARLPLPLLCGTRVLVVVPLEEPRPEPAHHALRQFLARWRHAYPCEAARESGAQLAIAWLGSDRYAPRMHEVAARALADLPRCFDKFEVLGRETLQGHSLPMLSSARGGASSNSLKAWLASVPWAPEARWRNVSELDASGRANALFLSALGIASARGARMLWLPITTQPLQSDWVSSLSCRAQAMPNAWLIGSPLLMDCEIEGGWLPFPACCDKNSPQRSEWHLGPTGIYASDSEAFLEYVREWCTSTLSSHHFHTALTSLLWRGYHEARQRDVVRRFLASAAIADIGAQMMDVHTARMQFPEAVLLVTLNVSRPLLSPSDASPEVIISTTRAPDAAERKHGAVEQSVLAKAPGLSVRISSAKVLKRSQELTHSVGISPSGAGEMSEHEVSWSTESEEGEGAPLGEFALTDTATQEKMLEQLAMARAGTTGRLIIGFGSADALELALNWAAACAHLEQDFLGGRDEDAPSSRAVTGNGGWLVVALDAQVHAHLVRSTLIGPAACALAPSQPASSSAHFHTRRLLGADLLAGREQEGRRTSILCQAAARVRTIAILLSRTEIELLACEVDAVPLKSPWPAISRHIHGELGAANQPPMAVRSRQTAMESHDRRHANLSSLRPFSTVDLDTPSPRRVTDLLLLSEWPDGLELCSDGGGDHARTSVGSWPCASLGIFYAAPSSLPVLNLFRNLTHRLEMAVNEECVSEAECPSVVALLAEALGLPAPLHDPLTPPDNEAPDKADRSSPRSGDAVVRGLRWSLLAPSLFPNGFVALRRPLLGSWREMRNDSDVPVEVVMMRVSWPWLRPGQRETQASLRYLLRELRLWWLPDTTVARAGPRMGRWLAYGVSSAVDGELHRQRGALRSALMLSHILHRTLVLPSFWMSVQSTWSTSLAGLYDYDAFASTFGDHRESSLIRQLPPRRAFHISLADSGTRLSGVEEGSPHITERFAARARGATAAQLRAWFMPWHEEPLLWLDRMYHRVNKLESVDEQATFDAAFRAAIRPAPEFAVVIDHVIDALSARGGYNCLHVSSADLERNGERAFSQAAASLPADKLTVLASSTALGGRARAWMGRHFSLSVVLAELLPAASRVFFEDVEGRINLGFEIVDIHVCASADIFVGNLLTPFSQAICYERDGLRNASVERGNERPMRPCEDLYGRTVTVKAATASL